MTIKGLDQLRKHVPDLNTPFGVIRFLLLPIILFFLITLSFNALRFTWPFWQLVVEILLGMLGFGMLFLFFQHRQKFRARFGPLAYRQAALRYGLPAVTMITAVVARMRYLPGLEIPLSGWYPIFSVLGWVLIVLGVLLALRAVQVFGVDNLTMLYVYFPEESRLVNHKIYDILRHPAYAALLLVAFGLAFLNGSGAALLSALFFSLGLWGWVRLVEEKELMERFGPSYAAYRQHVPAFWPHLRSLRGLFSFLILGR